MKARAFYSSRQQHFSSLPGRLKTRDYLIFPARFEIAVAMLVPRSWKAATQANATSAAATAYSESSRPVSSWKNLLIIVLLLLDSIRRCCSNEPTNEGGRH